MKSNKAVNTILLIALFFTVMLRASNLASAVFLLLMIYNLIFFRADIAAFFRAHRLPLTLLLMAGISGLALSDIPEKSAKGLYDYLRALLVLPFVAAALKNTQQEFLDRSFMRAAIGVLLFQLAIAVYFYFTSQGHSLRYDKHVYDTFGNLHDFANWIALTFLVLLVHTHHFGRWNPFNIAALALSLGLLAYTSSRGNILAVALLVPWVFVAHKPRLKKIWMISMTGFLAFFAASVWFTPQLCQSLNCPGSFSFRHEIYVTTSQLILDQPWFGYGLNSFKYLSGISERGGNLIMPHNIYLESLYSLGLIGSLLMVAGLYRLLPRRRLQVRSFSAELGMAVLIYLTLRGLVDMKLFSFGFLGMVFFALMLMHAQDRNQPGEQPHE